MLFEQKNRAIIHFMFFYQIYFVPLQRQTGNNTLLSNKE